MKQKTYRTALFGLLAALAAALSYFEGLLPTAAFLPPGAKPGFSNLVNLFAASFMGTVPALGIALLKACFAGLTRGGTAFFMSLCGGALSTLLMCLLLKRTRRLSFIGIGIAGAVCHNLGQLAVAAVLVGNRSVLGYAPVLLLCALAAGTLTGLVFRAVYPALQKIPYFKTRYGYTTIQQQNTKEKGKE